MKASSGRGFPEASNQPTAPPWREVHNGAGVVVD
jgi:hypothetical protein